MAAIALASAMALPGCSTTVPTAGPVQYPMPQIPADHGRIVLLRASGFAGSAVRPTLQLDGLAVGEARPGEFFFCDVAPGRHTINTRTESQSTISVALQAQETVYVRIAIAMGILVGRVNFTPMAESEGRQAIALLQYAGAQGMASPCASAPLGPAAPAGSATAPPAPAAVTLDDLEALLPRRP